MNDLLGEAVIEATPTSTPCPLNLGTLVSRKLAPYNGPGFKAYSASLKRTHIFRAFSSDWLHNRVFSSHSTFQLGQPLPSTS